MYAYSPDQFTIVKRFADLPSRHWVQDTVDPPTGHYEVLTVGNAASFGYYPVDTSAVRPADTATATWDRTVPFVTDRFVVTWVERAKTQAELDADAAQADREQARQAVTNLRAYADAASPTNAQTVAIVKLLCRVCIRLIRDQYGR